MGKGRLGVQKYSDRELTEGCRRGDLYYRELLYKRYFSLAMSISLRYADDRNEAMDIVNDSYMKVLDNLSEYDDERPFASWYSRIVVNTAIDRYRSRVRYNETLTTLSEDCLSKEEQREPDIDAELSAGEILELFSHLPDNYRLTFNLYEIEGYSHHEIGEMLGISASASRSNLTRAKQMLRELYRRTYVTARKDHGRV